MNACHGMAQGKVVLSGASRNTLKEFGLSSSPVFHIKPDVNQIVSQLEYLIENKDNIEEFGYKSRKFVETFHNHRRIAWCMKEQISRLRNCPKKLLEKVEIIVSDNCSSDDTEEIVRAAILDGYY